MSGCLNEATTSELRAVYARDSDAVVKLLGKTGHKWKRIRVLRMRQRRTMLQMMQRGDATRAMRRHLAVVDVRKRALRDFEANAETSAIYVQVHPRVRHAYVGQHGGVAHTRKEQHDRSIWKAQRRGPGDADDKSALPWHAFAARHGGVGSWIDLPVQLFDVDVRKEEVNRCERVARKAVGDLCVAGNAWSSKLTRTAKRAKQRRRRPVCKVRKGKPNVQREGAKGKWMTEYRCVMGEARVRTTQLCHILHSAKRRGCEVTVRVKLGAAQGTNWNTLRRVYGESEVRVMTATGRVKRVQLRSIQQSWLTTAVPLRRRIVLLRVHDIKVRDRGQAEMNKLVRVLGTTRAGGEQDLRSGGYELLEGLWKATRSLQDKRVREAAKARLSARALQMWGVSLRASPVLRIPGDMGFPARCAKRAARKLLELLGCRTRPQVARLRRRMRVVREQPDQVGGALCNWRKWCVHEYVPGCEPDCL